MLYIVYFYAALFTLGWLCDLLMRRDNNGTLLLPDADENDSDYEDENGHIYGDWGG